MSHVCRSDDCQWGLETKQRRKLLAEMNPVNLKSRWQEIFPPLRFGDPREARTPIHREGAWLVFYAASNRAYIIMMHCWKRLGIYYESDCLNVTRIANFMAESNTN